MNEYATHLRSLVKVSRLTQREISEQIGIDESTLSLYLSGKRTPGLMNHMKICRYFNVDQNFFYMT